MSSRETIFGFLFIIVLGRFTCIVCLNCSLKHQVLIKSLQCHLVCAPWRTIERVTLITPPGAKSTLTSLRYVSCGLEQAAHERWNIELGSLVLNLDHYYWTWIIYIELGSLVMNWGHLYWIGNTFIELGTLVLNWDHWYWTAITCI